MEGLGAVVSGSDCHILQVEEARNVRDVDAVHAEGAESGPFLRVAWTVYLDPLNCGELRVQVGTELRSGER